MVSSRDRHVFDFTSFTDEGIGVQSPDILNRAQWYLPLIVKELDRKLAGCQC